MSKKKEAEVKEILEDKPLVVEAPVVEVDEAAVLKARIQEIKGDNVKNQSIEKVKSLIDQLPKGKLASELGTPIAEYAARVMAAQSPDITIVPIVLGIAHTRRALKDQGYELEDIERVINKLEEAYEV